MQSWNNDTLTTKEAREFPTIEEIFLYKTIFSEVSQSQGIC